MRRIRSRVWWSGGAPWVRTRRPAKGRRCSGRRRQRHRPSCSSSVDILFNRFEGRRDFAGGSQRADDKVDGGFPSRTVDGRADESAVFEVDRDTPRCRPPAESTGTIADCKVRFLPASRAVQTASTTVDRGNSAGGAVGDPIYPAAGSGLQLTSAALASSITPALMPVFAGAIAWLFFRREADRSSGDRISCRRGWIGRPRGEEANYAGNSGRDRRSTSHRGRRDVGSLYDASEKHRIIVDSGSSADLLLVGNLFRPLLRRFRPFQADRRFVGRACLPINLPGLR